MSRRIAQHCVYTTVVILCYLVLLRQISTARMSRVIIQETGMDTSVHAWQCTGMDRNPS